MSAFYLDIQPRPWPSEVQESNFCSHGMEFHLGDEDDFPGPRAKRTLAC
jgi:hypothetical protein